MERLSKKFILLVVMLGIMFMPIGTVKATLQSNLNTHNKKETHDVGTWITSVRNMEKTGESMGLSETLNNDLTASSESNNIDMHFMKSTEYGAIAILSASGYGNPQILQESEIKSTTGNETGVYFSGETWELVAGGLEGYIFSDINLRYYDKYTNSQTSAKVGDSLGIATTTNPGCSRWHLATFSDWVTYWNSGSRYNCYYFIRGNGGIFSYSRTYVKIDTNGYVPINNVFYSARGVAISGAGL